MVHVGTSGCHYKHWIGPFYPEKLPASRMLDYYSRRFDTVELNNTFYRLPPYAGMENWRATTPAKFCFAARGSRFLTHMKKLKEVDVGIGRFFERVDRLRPKLGPIVFQLPPFWEVDAGRLESFLRALPKRHRYAFEFRNPTWHTEEVQRILGKHNAAFCIFEIAGFASAHPITADFTYVRLHGPGGAYQGSYSEAALKEWARRVEKWQKELKAIYLYFFCGAARYVALGPSVSDFRMAHGGKRHITGPSSLSVFSILGDKGASMCHSSRQSSRTGLVINKMRGHA